MPDAIPSRAADQRIPLSMAIANYRMYRYEARVAAEKAEAWRQIALGLQEIRRLNRPGRSAD